MQLRITHFTDPACPFAFSAEPIRWRLRWHYGLGGPREQRRYTTPTYEISSETRGTSVTVPGFNPIEAYETAIANLASELVRRPKPATVEELLAWADEPLATAEVAMITHVEPAEARVALSRGSRDPGRS